MRRQCVPGPRDEANLEMRLSIYYMVPDLLLHMKVKGQARGKAKKEERQSKKVI